jgi:hypothetical protein
MAVEHPGTTLTGDGGVHGGVNLMRHVAVKLQRAGFVHSIWTFPVQSGYVHKRALRGQDTVAYMNYDKLS